MRDVRQRSARATTEAAPFQALPPLFVPVLELPGPAKQNHLTLLMLTAATRLAFPDACPSISTTQGSKAHVIQLRRQARDPNAPNRFAPGDLVRHRRYGYRGVVVDLDLECRASQAWHRSNKTQPARDQPWYHVLVDGAEHSTYVAEENLMLDEVPAEIEHPLVALYFEGMTASAYVRNGRPWDFGHP